MKPRLLQFLLTLAVIGLVAYSLPGAIDNQFARAETSRNAAGPCYGSPSTLSVGPLASRLQPPSACHAQRWWKTSGRAGHSETYQGKTAAWWARRAVQARKDANKRGRTIRRLKAALTVTPRDHSLRAISYAATAYGVSYATLLRKAYCETGGTFDPYAKNRTSTASGLFQFLTSTWATTPYGRFSIWDPYANALAAGWMHAHGRGGEWVCR